MHWILVVCPLWNLWKCVLFISRPKVFLKHYYLLQIPPEGTGGESDGAESTILGGHQTSLDWQSKISLIQAISLNLQLIIPPSIHSLDSTFLKNEFPWLVSGCLFHAWFDESRCVSFWRLPVFKFLWCLPFQFHPSSEESRLETFKTWCNSRRMWSRWIPCWIKWRTFRSFNNYSDYSLTLYLFPFFICILFSFLFCCFFLISCICFYVFKFEFWKMIKLIPRNIPVTN